MRTARSAGAKAHAGGTLPMLDSFMQRFRNILVGVDLSVKSRSGMAEIGAGNQEAIRRAIWLARKNSAKLLFFSALNLSDKALHVLTEDVRSHLTRTVEEAIQAALAELVRQARADHVEASAMLVHGRAWLEIIRQVLRDQHDLVVVGARHLQGLRRVLFGSTARNLVHHCPCAVWVTKAAAEETRPLRVLVASDLSPVAEEALRLGISLRELSDATVHVLHVVDFPLDYMWSTGLPDATTEEYHQQVRAAAQRSLQEQVDRAADSISTAEIRVHLADGTPLPDHAILQFLQDHSIDLLVIGTIARGGISRLVIGNTAERLLPEVPCSVLAVKPADFHCFVHLD